MKVWAEAKVGDITIGIAYAHSEKRDVIKGMVYDVSPAAGNTTLVISWPSINDEKYNYNEKTYNDRIFICDNEQEFLALYLKLL